MNERCSQMGDRDTGNGFLCAFAPFALCVKIGPFTFSGERASTQRRGDAKTRRRQAAINPQMIADSHRWETGIQQRRQGKMVSFAPSRLLPFALKPARPRSRGSGHQRKDAETPSRYQSADDRRFSQVGDRDTTKTPGKNDFLCAFASFALCVNTGPSTLSGKRPSTQRRGDAKPLLGGESQ